MNIYLLSQTECSGYDTFDSCVVCAESDDEARRIHPLSDWLPDRSNEENWGEDDWASCPENVTCVLVGTAANGVKKGVLCASYNAG